MGFKQSKLENGHYLPSTPTLKDALEKQKPITVETSFGNEELMDPRSPFACRTPINEICKPPKNVYQQNVTPNDIKDKPMELLRKKIFSGFTYNLNDPRSPTLYLDRTPIVFENSPEKSLNLDDTFSDLFVETKASTSCNANETEEEMVLNSEPTKNSPSSIAKNLANEPDPRSPSIGVDRTPIIFFDDDEANEEDIIEKIITRLSLDMSSNSTSSITTQAKEVNVPKVPENKALERVRKNVGYKTKSTKMNALSRRNKIYEDRENFVSAKSALKSAVKGTRTPLSCMKNRSHLRSRSVENTEKLKKNQLQFTSLDDSFNLINSKKLN